MLPAQHRLRSSALFGQTIKEGRKKGSRTVVVYCYAHIADGGVNPSPASFESYDSERHVTPVPLKVTQGGPRVGLIVSKAVGNAVERHRVSRLLRHAMRDVLFDEEFSGHVSVSSAMLLVVRALPHSAGASFEELRRDISSCVRRATK